MLTKEIKFTDYNGREKTKTYYFNLNRVELTEMEVGVEGGLSESLKRISKEEDHAKIVAFFKDLILKSYGVKSDDGESFIKSEELSAKFSQTEAFVTLFTEISTNSAKAVEFVKGVIPADALNKEQLAAAEFPEGMN